MDSQKLFNRFAFLYELDLKGSVIEMFKNDLKPNEIYVASEDNTKVSLLTYIAFLSDKYPHAHDWIDLLLAHGGEINLLDEKKFPCVYYLIGKSSAKQETFHYLVQKGANIDLYLYNNYHLIEWAKNKDKLHWFYPYYEKINWTCINSVIEEEVKEGFENLKLKNRLEQEIKEQNKGMIKI